MSVTNFEIEKMRNEIDGFENYEAYLDSFITDKDRKFLESMDIARELIEQGINVKVEVMTRDEFKEKKELFEKIKSQQRNMEIRGILMSGVTVEETGRDPFLMALLEREEALLNGQILVILFIRIHLKRHKKASLELSGYLDLSERIKDKDMPSILKGEKLLIPVKSDLSYYNWNSGEGQTNSSKNFKVHTDFAKGHLIFKNKRERRAINVTDNTMNDENTKKIELNSLKPEYLQISIFDHYTNK